MKDGHKCKAYVTCLWTLVILCFSPKKNEMEKSGAKSGQRDYRRVLELIISCGQRLSCNKPEPSKVPDSSYYTGTNGLAG